MELFSWINPLFLWVLLFQKTHGCLFAIILLNFTILPSLGLDQDRYIYSKHVEGNVEGDLNETNRHDIALFSIIK